MASGCIMPSAGGKPQTDAMLVDKLPEEINEMKIRDDKAEKVGSGKRTAYSGLVVYVYLIYLRQFHF